MPARPGFRMCTDSDGKRHRVYRHRGRYGYWIWVTDECSGCTERGEMGGRKWGPFGCDECGYTGKVRGQWFVPLSMDSAAQRSFRETPAQRAAARMRRKRARYREEGSCQDCGAEAANGKTRCTPCGRRNASVSRPARNASRPGTTASASTRSANGATAVGAG